MSITAAGRHRRLHVSGAQSLPDTRDRRPLPHLNAYEDWIQERPAGSMFRGRHGPSAQQVRRIVVLRRDGGSFAAVGRALGMPAGRVRNILSELPEAML